MKISVEDKILEKYPTAEIGYLVAQVFVKKTDPFVESLKQNLLGYLTEKSIHATNFVTHPQLFMWRKIYKDDFQVKESSYRSSLEALVRRLVTGKGVWNIWNVVDLYNCCSVLSLLPMGGYDLDKISGDIAIRYAKVGESFHGIGERVKIETQPHHIVYADDQRVICWLWNHKDALDTCIDEQTKSVIFFIDSLEPHQMSSALTQLRDNLEKINGVPISSGILNCHTPSGEV